MYKFKTCKGSKFINLLICEDGGFVTIQNNQIRKRKTKLLKNLFALMFKNNHNFNNSLANNLKCKS